MQIFNIHDAIYSVLYISRFSFSLKFTLYIRKQCILLQGNRWSERLSVDNATRPAPPDVKLDHFGRRKSRNKSRCLCHCRIVRAVINKIRYTRIVRSNTGWFHSSILIGFIVNILRESFHFFARHLFGFGWLSPFALLQSRCNDTALN